MADLLSKETEFKPFSVPASYTRGATPRRHGALARIRAQHRRGCPCPTGAILPASADSKSPRRTDHRPDIRLPGSLHLTTVKGVALDANGNPAPDVKGYALLRLQRATLEPRLERAETEFELGVLRAYRHALEGTRHRHAEGERVRFERAQVSFDVPMDGMLQPCTVTLQVVQP